jgi:hypothetical protein
MALKVIGTRGPANFIGVVLNLQKLDHGNEESVRLLVSVSDVTDVRIAARVAAA